MRFVRWEPWSKEKETQIRGVRDFVLGQSAAEGNAELEDGWRQFKKTILVAALREIAG